MTSRGPRRSVRRSSQEASTESLASPPKAAAELALRMLDDVLASSSKRRIGLRSTHRDGNKPRGDPRGFVKAGYRRQSAGAARESDGPRSEHVENRACLRGRLPGKSPDDATGACKRRQRDPAHTARARIQELRISRHTQAVRACQGDNGDRSSIFALTAPFGSSEVQDEAEGFHWLLFGRS